MATPFTVIFKTATKNRLSITFKTPDAASAINGVFVSPTLRKIAASKLYSRITGIPMRYIRRYKSASGITSFGTFMSSRSGLAINSPSSPIKIPPVKEMKTDVCTALFTVSLSPCPTAWAITTLLPRAIPIKRFTIRPITELLAPTAATAAVRCEPVKFPTIATSDALKSCSNIAVAAIGNAN